MSLKFTIILVSITGTLAADNSYPFKNKIQPKAGQQLLTTRSDQASAESGLVGLAQPAALNNGAGTKYFQYAHSPTHDHYEHGHKQGNEHHFIERHEKGQPHLGEVKNKVRWGDKHGGYGEHYWDLNHAGHDHESDEEETEQLEVYAEYPQKTQSDHILLKPIIHASSRSKRNPDDEVEFLNDKARLVILNDQTPKHGGNYRIARKRTPNY